VLSDLPINDALLRYLSQRRENVDTAGETVSVKEKSPSW